MKKLFIMCGVAALLATAPVFTGCNDEIVQPQTKSSGGELLSRGAYDYPAVEWDNVDKIAVACNLQPSTTELSLPWDSGQSGNNGIPEDWLDSERRNPDPRMRAYSRQNGWNMVCHNLSDATQPAKYFGLYNKYTGVLRLFFYEISASSGVGTTNCWTGLRVSGSTSLLNFTGRYPAAMSDRMTNPMVFSSPECEISNSSLQKVGYKANNWYGLEVELAYDANAVSSNKLSARLWGQYLTSISMTGTANGSITGNVQTVYSNSSSSMNVSLSANVGNTTINNGESAAKEELQKKADQGGNFFNSLWNNLKGQIPQLAGKAAKEGLEALFSGGTSLITKGLSKLLGLSGRKTSAPMTSTSKVDLGLTSQLTLTGSEETAVVGFGKISAFDLPQFASNNKLYTGKLGVWNLQDYPTVTVDLLMTSMFYPKELVPNPDRPRAAYPTYSYRLTNATLVVNPELLTNYKVENMSQQLVYTRYVGGSLGTIEAGSAYSLNGSTEFYRPSSGNTVKIKDDAMDFMGGRWDPSNPESSYSRYWYNYDAPVTGSTIKCHVYFELVSKTDSNERYAYSKYFPCKAVKGTFSHREETITQ